MERIRHKWLFGIPIRTRQYANLCRDEQVLSLASIVEILLQTFTDRLLVIVDESGIDVFVAVLERGSYGSVHVVRVYLVNLETKKKRT